jgi:hypothetical protein
VQLLVDVQFRIGQRVEHRTHGMTGVVVGWDRACCESTAWQQANSVDTLQQVRLSPVLPVPLHALLLTRKGGNSNGRVRHLPHACVAQELPDCRAKVDVAASERVPFFRAQSSHSTTC